MSKKVIYPDFKKNNLPQLTDEERGIEVTQLVSYLNGQTDFLSIEPINMRKMLYIEALRHIASLYPSIKEKLSNEGHTTTILQVIRYLEDNAGTKVDEYTTNENVNLLMDQFEDHKWINIESDKFEQIRKRIILASTFSKLPYIQQCKIKYTGHLILEILVIKKRKAYAKRFCMITNEFNENYLAKIKGNALKVYMALKPDVCMWKESKNFCVSNMFNDEIARLTGISKTNLDKYFKQLVKLGLIENRMTKKFMRDGIRTYKEYKIVGMEEDFDNEQENYEFDPVEDSQQEEHKKSNRSTPKKKDVSL